MRTPRVGDVVRGPLGGGKQIVTRVEGGMAYLQPVGASKKVLKAGRGQIAAVSEFIDWYLITEGVAAVVEGVADVIGDT